MFLLRVFFLLLLGKQEKAILKNELKELTMQKIFKIRFDEKGTAEPKAS